MVYLVLYLLAYCSELTAYFIFSRIYNSIIPDYLYNSEIKGRISLVQEDINFVLEILQFFNLFSLVILETPIWLAR
jgi:hypothetical protein